MAVFRGESLVAGIDLGGTKIMATLFNKGGDVLGESRLPTPAQEGPEPVVRATAVAVRQACQGAGRAPGELAAIGLAAAGLCDGEKGVVVFSPHLPGWQDVPVAELLGRELGRPVFLGNDVNLAALAEQRFGVAAGQRNVVYVAIGTGIGGAAIINGELYLGDTGMSAEVGHMTVALDGPRCACGNRGCLEAFASGSALEGEARKRLEAGSTSILAALVRRQDYSAVTSEAIFASLAKGDALAVEVVENAIRYLGVGLANVVNIFNPSLMVVGGGLASQWDSYIAPALRVMEQRVLPGMAKGLVVAPPALGPRAGVIGAAAMARDRVRES